MCPPGTDQTERSPQHWQLEAPDKEQVHRLGNTTKNYDSKHFVQAVFTADKLFDIYALLARPIIPESLLQPIQPCHPTTRQVIKSGFQRLSNELLDMILAEVEKEKNDLMSLGLTNVFLWNLVISRIRQQCCRISAPWANTRLLLQGSYSRTLPAGFIDEEKERAENKGMGRSGWGMCAARRFFWQQYHNQEVVSISEHLMDLQQAMQAMQPHRTHSGISPAMWLDLQKQLDPPNLFPQDRIWALRNLSKHEFITSDLLGSEPAGGQGKQRAMSSSMEPIRFEDVLLTRICWSSIPSDGDRSLRCHPGAWAGDCFDLVPLDEHNSEIHTGKRWRNVGVPVIKRVSRLRDVISSRRASNTL